MNFETKDKKIFIMKLSSQIDFGSQIIHLCKPIYKQQ